jgi:hypothetical protein
MKATSEELQFHQRILARNDPIAQEGLATWLYPLLVQDLRKRAYWETDLVLIEEAVGEAFLNYCIAPEKYDPSRLTLRAFLLMEAEHDLKNAQARERRRTERCTFFPFSSEPDPNLIDNHQDPDTHMREKELWNSIFTHFPNARDREIAVLILERVRSPEPYIELLCLNSLPRSQQIKEVKRHKDRIKWHLRKIIGDYINE